MNDAPVLYVEDDENDAFLMQRAFTKTGLTSPLHIVPDGSEAIRYLSESMPRAGPAQTPRPRLVLLDLNLPRITGLEVIKWIREQPELRSICVLVFTSSSQERDIRTAYTLGANGYLVKPASSEKLLDVVAALRDTCFGPDFEPAGWLDFKGNLPPPATDPAREQAGAPARS